jgi:hypothetical protein
MEWGLSWRVNSSLAGQGFLRFYGTPWFVTPVIKATEVSYFELVGSSPYHFVVISLPPRFFKYCRLLNWGFPCEILCIFQISYTRATWQSPVSSSYSIYPKNLTWWHKCWISSSCNIHHTLFYPTTENYIVYLLSYNWWPCFIVPATGERIISFSCVWRRRHHRLFRV